MSVHKERACVCMVRYVHIHKLEVCVDKSYVSLCPVS